MITAGIDKGLEYAEVKKLDDIEKSNGNDAFAQLIYEEGPNLSARFLVLLWVITTILPRTLEWFDKKKKEKEKQSNPISIIEKEVKGERIK